MKVLKYKYTPVPSLKISQRSANKLGELYDEMIHVYKAHGDVAFDQDDCDTCVIGNGLRAGILLNKETGDEGFFDTPFSRAIDSIGLPTEITIEGEINHDGLNDFLFGSTTVIYDMCDLLQLPVGRDHNNGRMLDEIDACVRIAGVLDRAGYDVSDFANLPRARK